MFYAIVADVDVSSEQNLSGIGGVGKNFLISGHPGIEAYFTGGSSNFPGCFAFKGCSVLKK
jgi:hypothetical protein